MFHLVIAATLAHGPFNSQPQPPEDAERVAAMAVRGELRCLRVVSGDPEYRGIVAAGSQVTRRLTFGNSADHRVELEIAAKTCGCLGAAFDKSSLAPGEVATLDLTVVAAPSLEEQAQFVTFRVKCADPTGPAVQTGVCGVRFRADIPFELHPTKAAATVVEGEPVEFRVSLRQTGERWQAVQILGAETTLPAVSPSEPMMPVGSPNVRVIRFAGTASLAGLVDGQLRITTNVPEHPAIVVPVTLRVLEPWRALPGGVVLSSKASVVVVELEARSQHWTGVEVARAVLADPEAPVQVEMVKSGPGAATVRVRAADDGRELATRLTLLDHENRVLATLPVAILVR